MAAPTPNTPRPHGSRFSISSISVVSTIHEVDGGEYEQAARSNNHTYRGIDGRALRERDPDPTPNWKPFTLRWPFLLILTAVILVLIGVTEWACRSLPVVKWQNPATPTPIDDLLAPRSAFVLGQDLAHQSPKLAARAPQGKGNPGGNGSSSAPPPTPSTGGGSQTTRGGSTTTRGGSTTTRGGSQTTGGGSQTTGGGSQTTGEGSHGPGSSTGVTSSSLPPTSSKPDPTPTPTPTLTPTPSPTPTPTPKPETTPPKPETTHPTPETTTPKPETTPPKPETTSLTPETTPPKPEPTPPKPETTPPMPETTTPPKPETTPPKPEPTPEPTLEPTPPKPETTPPRPEPTPDTTPPAPDTTPPRPESTPNTTPPKPESTLDPTSDLKPTQPSEQPKPSNPISAPVTQSAPPTKTDDASDRDPPKQPAGKDRTETAPPQATREPVHSGEETSARPPVNGDDRSTLQPAMPVMSAAAAASATPEPRPKRPGGSDSEQLAGVDDSDSGSRPDDRPGDPGDAGNQKTNKAFRPTASIDWAEPSVVVTTDSNGAITTKTLTPAPVSATLVRVLTDERGRPTRTERTTMALPPRTLTLTNAAGRPTATVTRYPQPAKPSAEASTNGNPVGIKSYYLGKPAHLAALFLPVLLAVLSLAAARMVESSARHMHPYHRLTHPSGAPAMDSICMRAGVFHSIPSAIRSLAPEGGVLRYPPVLFLSKLLLLVAAVLVPFWPEAFGIRQNEDLCVPEDRPCAATLVVSPPNARAAIGILSLMALISLVVLVSMLRWRTGVASNPWSIIGTAALAGNPEIRSLLLSLPTTGNSRAEAMVGKTEGESTAAMAAARVKGRITHEQLLRAVGSRRFRLGVYSVDGSETTDYGVTICSGAEGMSLQGNSEEDDREGLAGAGSGRGDEHDYYGYGGVDYRQQQQQQQGNLESAPLTRQREHYLPFMMLSNAPRLGFVALACGLLVVVLYYVSWTSNSSFERFMGQQGYAARVVFTLIGLAISFWWGSFFSNVSLASPYLLLSQRGQPAGRTVLLAPSSNPASGLWRALRARQLFLASVSLAALAAEAMPVLLHMVPARLHKSHPAHAACAWAAVALLFCMVAVVVASFFVAWPSMPADPSSAAGAMVYVCDSSGVAWAAAGSALLPARDRDRVVEQLALLYEFGPMEGASGAMRIGVDADETSGASDVGIAV